MAVLSATRDMLASTAEVSAEDGVTKLTETYSVLTDDQATGQLEVLAAVPAVGSAHWSVTGATARSRSLSRTGPKSWMVPIDYSNEVSSKGPTPSDPLSWTIQWSIAFETEERGLEKDAQITNPIVEATNTAGDWFENQPTFPYHRAVLSIQRNLSSLSLGLVRETVGKVNSGLFLNQPAHHVLCRSISATGPHFYESTSYATATFEFVLDRDAHLIEILSQGYNELIGGVKTPIKDDVNGRPITRPQNLDGNGAATTGDAKELTFALFEETSFAVFNLSLSDLTGLST